MKTKKIIIGACVLLLCYSNSLLAQNKNRETQLDNWQIEYFVKKNLKLFPLSTLQDLYKSFFQSIFGPEHLVSDKNKVIAYLDKELMEEYSPHYPLYQTTGISGDYIRVNLSVIKNGYVDKELLADCFIWSSQIKTEYSLEDLQRLWLQITTYIEKENISLRNYQQDKDKIEKLFNQNTYVCSHSSIYKETYLPHYRIIEKDIFYKEIYPLIRKHLYSK